VALFTCIIATCQSKIKTLEYAVYTNIYTKLTLGIANNSFVKNRISKNAKKLGVKFVWEDGIQQHDCDAIVIAAGCWSGEVAKNWNIDIPVKGQKHTVYNILTEVKHIPTMPLVADLTTGVYWRPEGEGYIVGYDGNSQWDSDNLEPND